MKIKVKLTPSASRNHVKKEADREYTVYVTAPPRKGQANKALIEVISDHLNVKKHQVFIEKGHKSRHKTLVIVTEQSTLWFTA